MTLPFDHWWDIYPGFRKKAKVRCREKFDAHAIEVQRQIYLNTKARAAGHPDWKDPQYICAPEVYLNQRMWEEAVPTEAQTRSRPLEIPPTEGTAQQLNGLERLQEASGGQDAQLARQIQELKDKMGAREV